LESKKKRAEHIQRLLDLYIPDPKPSLHYSTPFTLLVAVLLSAQCTDERVNKVTPTLFAHASTAEAMCRLDVREIQECIRTCGLSAFKAKAILGLSKMIVEKYSGAVPKTRKELQTLPGVGRKTASVVLTQAFSIPAFPVDTHIFRLAHRWHLSEGKTVEAVEHDLRRLFPKNSWGRVHVQMILYARNFCPARQHVVESCPICFALK
jgi:endonuclease III